MFYEIQGYYGEQHGWESVCSENNREDAEQRLAEYNENEPEFRHRIVEEK